VTSLPIVSESDAHIIEERFNGFHDAFFSRIEISSTDKFQEDGSHLVTGELTLILEIWHNNYDVAARGRGRIVRGTFQGVRDIALIFRGHAVEWSIYALSFHAAMRVSEYGDSEACLQARLVTSVYEPETGWRQIGNDIFTFKIGSFEELIDV